MSNLTHDEVIDIYVRKYGHSAKNVMLYLINEQDFIEAWDSKVGEEIMHMIIEDTQNSLNKIMSKLATADNGNAMDQKLVALNADYQAGLRFITRVRDRINAYNKKKL